MPNHTDATVRKSLSSTSVEIPLSQERTFECSATLLAYLCFPEPKAHLERRRAYRVMCGWFLKEKMLNDPSWQWHIQHERPVYFNIHYKDVAWFLRNSERKIVDRVMAASMALTFFSKVPMKNLSVSKLAKAAVPYAREKDPVNIISRIWGPSLPVLHLAMAIVKSHKTWLPESERLDMFTQMFRNEELVRSIVTEAEAQRQLIETVPKLRSAAAKLIRFHLT